MPTDYETVLDHTLAATREISYVYGGHYPDIRGNDLLREAGFAPTNSIVHRFGQRGRGHRRVRLRWRDIHHAARWTELTPGETALRRTIAPNCIN